MSVVAARKVMSLSLAHRCGYCAGPVVHGAGSSLSRPRPAASGPRTARVQRRRPGLRLQVHAGSPASGRRTIDCGPTTARQRPVPEKATPRTVPYSRATAPAPSAHGSSSPVSRTRPPAVQERRPRRPRGGAPLGAAPRARSGTAAARPELAAAVPQRTVSPSGRARDPATGSPIGDPAPRSARHVAGDVVGREGEGGQALAARVEDGERRPCHRRTRAASPRAPDRTPRSARGTCRRGTRGG